MDGRVQLPVILFLQKYFKAEFVDSITEPGPIKILADPAKWPEVVDSILNRVGISFEVHSSVGLALVAHHDCAGNPKSKIEQLEQLKKSIDFFRAQNPDMQIIGLWVNEIEFSPNLNQNLKAFVNNNMGYDARVKLSARGELAKYVTFNDEYLDIPKGGRAHFTFNLNIVRVQYSLDFHTGKFSIIFL